MFESNILSKKADVDEIINLYSKKAYDLISRNNNTILRLNLKKIKNKTKFTDSIKNYYIGSYPENYNPISLPHLNTLESAKTYCINHNHTGVVFQNETYTVRTGKYINYSDTNIILWVYI